MMTETITPNRDTTYTAEQFAGVALRWVGYAQTWLPVQVDVGEDDDHPVWVDDPDGEVEWGDEPEWSRVVMVGDDRVHVVETAELRPLDEGAYCSECGQVGV